MRSARLVAVLTIVVIVGAVSSTVDAGPWRCYANPLTLSEQLAQSVAAVLVRWVEGTKPTNTSAGTTVYEIRELIRGKEQILKPGDRITLSRFRAGNPGDLFLLMSTKGQTVEWGSPLEVTETSYHYIFQAPSPEAVPAKRLEYFLEFLEFPDPLIANDAYTEFANADYKDITLLSKSLPREKICKWVTSADTHFTRLGLYGLMLGLCGTAEDAQVLEQKINLKTDDFRLGIDGLISGYLLLTGAKGLDVIDDAKLKNRKVPFSETYAAMLALRFMWQYGGNTIEKERLRQSMRILLDQPELADLVIADLSRWSDWSVQARLMSLYGAEGYNIPSIKRAIVRYMLACAKDVPEGEAVQLPPHVVAANKYLDALRQKDSRTVKEAERFFFLK